MAPLNIATGTSSDEDLFTAIEKALADLDSRDEFSNFIDAVLNHRAIEAKSRVLLRIDGMGAHFDRIQEAIIAKIEEPYACHRFLDQFEELLSKLRFQSRGPGDESDEENELCNVLCEILTSASTATEAIKLLQQQFGCRCKCQ